MAAHWDRQNTTSVLSGHKSCHGQTATIQPPLAGHSGHMRAPSPLVPDQHGAATPSGSPRVESSLVPVPYYEAYTIRPDDLTSSEERWLLPHKKLIPATQEDLHTEVITRRQSGRTACRELEDCHGPKRQYIDRLINERNASTSLGHFEVAQLRLERIPRDPGKAPNRNSNRNYHARDFRQKDSTKPRQKTVYMHIILQFMDDPNRRLTGIPPDNFAPRNPNVGNSHRSGRQQTSEENFLLPPLATKDQPSTLPEANQRPILARGYPYTTGTEQFLSLPSRSFVSRGTQTTFPAHTRPHSGRYSSNKTDGSDDPTLGGVPTEDTWTMTTNVEEETPKNSPSSDDKDVSMGESAAAQELAKESTETESTGINEYEKPPWFHNLQPVKSPGITDQQTDVCWQPDDGEGSTTHEEDDTGHVREQDDEKVLKAHGEGAIDYTQPNISSWSGEEIGQSPPEHPVNNAEHHRDDNDQQSLEQRENESAPMATEVRKLGSIDEHPSTGSTGTPLSEYFPDVPETQPQEKVPPSERYKPRPALNLLPARPSLIRSPATYDSRPPDDFERKSSKRVSFQNASMPLYAPPSTSTSSPVSPSISPRLPFRTLLAKPPPVSIPPGRYTPIASSSSSGSHDFPPSSPATRRHYTCLEPTCGSSFDHSYDRDRHERQHEIGDPLYSECPICHYSRSGGSAVDGGLRNHLIAHINRRHTEDMESAKRTNCDDVTRRLG